MLAAKIAGEPDMEVLAPVPLSAVCFRFRPSAVTVDGLDTLNQKILQRVVRRGKVFLSNAGIHGKFCLRACFVNHRTTAADVELIVREVLEVGRELTAEAES